MRASRLLRILLLLQNRGRLTSAELAEATEVHPRTILRDVDALTEAGLPIIVYQGNQGGIELGFNYRTRLTGLSSDEAEAMAMILMYPMPELEVLAMAESAAAARTKLIESFPDGVRGKIADAQTRFRFAPAAPARCDPRVAAMADAVRDARIVRIRSTESTARTIHPVTLVAFRDGWEVVDDLDPACPIALDVCGVINISALRFDAATKG